LEFASFDGDPSQPDGYNRRMPEEVDNPSDETVVEQIRHLSAIFEERAEETDRKGPLNDLLRSNIHHLAHIGFFAARVASNYGGLGISRKASKTCAQLLSAACGVTAFTQQQLHAGSNFVTESEDDCLKSELLPQFASGANLCGVGFSHLRRSGPPVVKAVPTAEGFLINGVTPWITAWDILDSFILGASLPDGSAFFAYLPIKEFKNSLFPGKSMELAVMDASDTVELQITDLKLPRRYVLFQRPVGFMQEADYNGIIGHIDMPIGCARGSARYIRAVGEKRQIPQALSLADIVDKNADYFDEQSQVWSGPRSDDPGYFNSAMRIRVGAIKLAVDAAAAGVALSGGSAHLRSNAAQRRFRESAFYLTQAQTSDIQNSLLEAFIHG
jgi:alkylation response protein AidB-like acyl-CoA dehydrogenase